MCSSDLVQNLSVINIGPHTHQHKLSVLGTQLHDWPKDDICPRWCPTLASIHFGTCRYLSMIIVIQEKLGKVECPIKLSEFSRIPLRTYFGADRTGFRLLGPAIMGWINYFNPWIVRLLPFRSRSLSPQTKTRTHPFNEVSRNRLTSLVLEH